MKSKNVIEIENLNLFYGNFQALEDINIQIERNKVTALIGPSGCGKSTFLRTLNRMNDLIKDVTVKGNIILDGVDIYENINLLDLRKKVGMVFQKPNPFPMSIYDNVAYGPKAHGVKNKAILDKIVKENLGKAALWDEVKDRLDKNAMGLSGGQQQRLCIARALAVEPEVILMDEPTASLDPIATLKIEGLINQLKKKYSIIIVTHSMQQAGRISDKTAFFLMGEIIEYSETAKLFSNPQEKKTEDYITGRFG